MEVKCFWIGMVIFGIAGIIVEILYVIGQVTEGNACKVNTYQVCTIVVHDW